MRLTDLEADLKALDDLRAEQLKQQQERHSEALERLEERKDVEKERELLAMQKEYQGKLEKANEDTTTKLRELYEQIERQRVAYEQQLREIQTKQPSKDK